MLPQFELRRLRYFIVLAEELHFTKAANRLNMAQPPLSVQIRKLEEEIGFLLFERDNRNVQLTDAGRAFFHGAKNALFELTRAINTGQQMHRGEAGHIHLGFISSGGVTFIPHLLRNLNSRLPHVSTQIRQLSSNGALEALRESIIDLAIVRTPLFDKDFDYYPLTKDKVVLAIPADHPKAQKKNISLKEMSNEAFLQYLPNEGHAAHKVVQMACLKSGFVPKVAEYIDDVYGMLGLVAAGIGIALLPRSVAKLNVQHVLFYPLNEVDEYFELSLVWRKNDSRSLIASIKSVIIESSHQIGSIQ